LAIGLVRIEFALGRRLDAQADVAAIVRLENEHPIHVADVRQGRVQLIERSAAWHEQVEHFHAERSQFLELLTAMREAQPYHIIAGNRHHRVDLIARSHFDAAAAALVQELHARVKVGAAEHIHFLGGAAYPRFFGEQVQLLLPIVELAIQPETRNVFGALASLGGAVKKAKKVR